MDKLPECPVCWANRNVRLWGRILFWLECDTASGGCGESTIKYATRDGATTPWAKAEEKRKALIPRLSEKLPDSVGDWWWWNGSKDDAPIIFTIGGSAKYYFVMGGQYELKNSRQVEKFGGHWAKVQMPEMPEEGEDG